MGLSPTRTSFSEGCSKVIQPFSSSFFFVRSHCLSTIKLVCDHFRYVISFVRSAAPQILTSFLDLPLLVPRLPHVSEFVSPRFNLAMWVHFYFLHYFQEKCPGHLIRTDTCHCPPSRRRSPSIFQQFHGLIITPPTSRKPVPRRRLVLVIYPPVTGSKILSFKRIPHMFHGGVIIVDIINNGEQGQALLFHRILTV